MISSMQEAKPMNNKLEVIVKLITKYKINFFNFRNIWKNQLLSSKNNNVEKKYFLNILVKNIRKIH